jgi:hypothetical protein
MPVGKTEDARSLEVSAIIVIRVSETGSAYIFIEGATWRGKLTP